MKHLFVLGAAAAALLLAPAVHAQGTLSTAGNVTVGTYDGQSVFVITNGGSDAFGALDITLPSTQALSAVNDVSVDYVTTAGSFGVGAPRITIEGNSNPAGQRGFIYLGSDTGGTFTETDPNAGNSTFYNTGDLTTSSASDTQTNGLGYGAYTNAGTNTTFGNFVTDAGGTTPVNNISLVLDQGVADTTIDVASFTVDGVVYTPSDLPTPEPASVVPFGIAAMGLFGLMLRARRRQHSA